MLCKLRLNLLQVQLHRTQLASGAAGACAAFNQGMLAASGGLLLFSHCLPIFLVKMVCCGFFCSHSVQIVVPFGSAGRVRFVAWQVMELVALLSFGF